MNRRTSASQQTDKNCGQMDRTKQIKTMRKHSTTTLSQARDYPGIKTKGNRKTNARKVFPSLCPCFSDFLQGYLAETFI